MASAQVIRMRKLDDETLMAFADGALDTEQAREVEAALAGDAAARATVARFRATRGLLEAAYPEEPAPELLERRVRAMARRERRPAAPAYGRWGLPLAAAVALTLGLAGGWLAAQRGGDPLTAALERTPSGTAVALAEGGALTPTETFRDREGRWCRAFEQGGATGAACREPGGAWRLAFLVPAGQGDAYAPAGEGPEPGDALLGALRAGAPVDAATERALIAGGWGRR